MKKETFKELQTGDVVRHKSSNTNYVIMEDFGDRKTAVRTVDLTNPDEWELVLKATFSEPYPTPKN